MRTSQPKSGKSRSGGKDYATVRAVAVQKAAGKGGDPDKVDGVGAALQRALKEGA
jgi:hypothetical protein